MPDVTFHVIDNDRSPSYSRSLETTFHELRNVEVYRTDPDDFPMILDTARQVAPKVGPRDWLVMDPMGTTWPAVQSWFINELHGVDDDEYFMAVRKAKLDANAKKGSPLAPFEGFMDWPVINRKYARLVNVLFKTQGHLYLTAEQASLGEKESRETSALFGPYGVKPAGQKALGHAPSTVLWCRKSAAGYTVTTVKDRDRGELENEEVNDLGIDYLVKIAGWSKKLAKGEGA